MILNTFISGPQAWFFLADERGYLRDEGIELEFVEGDTAANAVPKVASPEFDVGYGDMNALIELAAAGGPSEAVGVFATFNSSPYTIAVAADSPIRSPRDLEGRRLASHHNDAAYRMMPEFALETGLDTSRIAVEITALRHKETMPLLVDEHRWDGVFGFVNTLSAASIEAGIDPARKLRFLEFKDYLPDLYGMVLLVTRKLADSEPDLVSGLVRAVNRGLRDVLADPGAAIDAVARRNPRIDRAANLARLKGTLDLEMSSPEGTMHRIGDVDDERLGRAIGLIVQAKAYPRRPEPGEIFTRRFLPPLEDRVRSLTTRNS